MSRNKFKHRMKEGVTMGLSLKSPFCFMCYGLNPANGFQEFSDFFNQLIRQHWIKLLDI
jgi:hypothetical protein